MKLLDFHLLPTLKQFLVCLSLVLLMLALSFFLSVFSSSLVLFPGVFRKVLL